MITLEMAVNDAIHRIKNAYDQTDGKLYLSFSGGKDSTIVAELIRMAGLEKDIPAVFANTGVELNATIDFVENFKWPEKTTLRPEMPLPQIIKKHGVPISSKAKAKFLYLWQKQIETGSNPLEKTFGTRLLGRSGSGADKLAYKHFHLLHPDLEYKISHKCCHYLKKRPFDLYERESGNFNVILGIRVAEGGVRASQYKNCFFDRKKYGYVQKVSLPIIDWTDELCDEFISTYDIELSKAYTEYGFERTGCLLCPFGHKTLASDAKILFEKEPLKYRAAKNLFGRAYMDAGIQLEFDEDYMKEFNRTEPERTRRRTEMLRKWK